MTREERGAAFLGKEWKQFVLCWEEKSLGGAQAALGGSLPSVSPAESQRIHVVPGAKMAALKLRTRAAQPVLGLQWRRAPISWKCDKHIRQSCGSFGWDERTKLGGWGAHTGWSAFFFFFFLSSLRSVLNAGVVCTTEKFVFRSNGLCERSGVGPGWLL